MDASKYSDGIVKESAVQIPMTSCFSRPEIELPIPEVCEALHFTNFKEIRTTMVVN